MRIALAQIGCEWGDPAANLRKIAYFCEEAAETGSDWVLFPELTISGIFKSPEVVRVAEAVDGPSLRQVARLACRCRMAVGIGFSEKSTGLPFNAYAIFDQSGHLVGVYRKNHLPKLEVPFWQAHWDRPLFSLEGSRVAVSLCWDTRFPDDLADYAAQGAELLVMPHAWDSDALDQAGRVIDYNSMEEIVDYHRDPDRKKWKDLPGMWEEFVPYIPSLASRHRVWALFVNQTGQPHPSIRFVGPTFAADPSGRIVARCNGDSEQLVHFDLSRRDAPSAAERSQPQGTV